MMAGKPASPRIVWFRDDLRLSDHPALHAAAKTGAPVICLYVLDEASNAQARPPGGAARWWLAQSLRALQASLTSMGSALVLRRGPAASVIAALACEHVRPLTEGMSGRRANKVPLMTASVDAMDSGSAVARAKKCRVGGFM